MSPKITLLTNINFVQQFHLRLECHALLIEANQPSLFGGTSNKIRGFGTSGDAAIFTQWTEHGSFTLESVDSRGSALMLGDNRGESKPLFSGSNLHIDGKKYFIQIDSPEFPLDQQDVTALEYEAIWDLLAYKVEKYWDAPNMPHNRWSVPRYRHQRSGVPV